MKLKDLGTFHQNKRNNQWIFNPKIKLMRKIGLTPDSFLKIEIPYPVKLKKKDKKNE